MERILLLSIMCFYFALSASSQLMAVIPATPTKNVPMRSDNDIAHAVKSAFISDKFIANESIGVAVQVDNGVATLTGTVASEKAKNEIAAKARSVGGVRQVINSLQVQGQNQGQGQLPKTTSNPAK